MELHSVTIDFRGGQKDRRRVIIRPAGGDEIVITARTLADEALPGLEKAAKSHAEANVDARMEKRIADVKARKDLPEDVKKKHVSMLRTKEAKTEEIRRLTSRRLAELSAKAGADGMTKLIAQLVDQEGLKKEYDARRA